MAITLLMQDLVQKGDETMDQTTVGVFFETGDKVRLTHPYPELEQGKEGVFMQYIGEFALVEFDEVHAPISPYDLEKVEEVVAAQPIKNFANGDKVVLFDQTPTDDKYFILQPGTEVLIRAQDQQKNCTRVEGHCFDGTDQYLLIDNLIDNETLVVSLEEP